MKQLYPGKNSPRSGIQFPGRRYKIACLLFTVLAILFVDGQAQPVSRHGQLSVRGTALMDENGEN